MATYSRPLSPPSPLALGPALKLFERESGLSLTIHDTHGVMVDPALSRQRGRHPHEACQQGRYRESGWNTMCFKDCAFRSEKLAAASPNPFVKTCWKGLVEVVAPIYRGPVHLLTLYGGPFRLTQGFPATMPKLFWFQTIYNKLRPWDPQIAQALGETLHLLGQGILSGIPGLETDGGGSRAVRIARFLRAHSHEDIGLADLAQYLGLSPSRTRHVTISETGKTFGNLLIDQRLLRGRNLLLATDHPLAHVAEAAGFKNPFHFSRVFRKKYGVSPGRYRKSE